MLNRLKCYAPPTTLTTTTGYYRALQTRCVAYTTTWIDQHYYHKNNNNNMQVWQHASFITSFIRCCFTSVASNTSNNALQGEMSTTANTLALASTYTHNNEPAVIINTPVEKIEIVPSDHPSFLAKSNLSGSNSSSFADMLRVSAQYIHAHRDKVMVVHISSKLMEMASTEHSSGDEKLWDSILDDIAHMWLLGVKIVIVVDCRSHVNKKTLKLLGQNSLPLTDSSVPIDSQVLRVIKEEMGFIRFETERCLVKALSRFRKQGGAVSGNFYSANPVGVVDGQDFKFAGNIRNIDIEKVSRVHQANEIAIVSPLGISPSGEIFYVNSHEVAARFAISLGASKLIYCLENPSHLLFHTSRGPELLQSLQYVDAKSLNNRYRSNSNSNEDISEMLVALGASMAPLQLGVKRAHIINPSKGALLQELYTVSILYDISVSVTRYIFTFINFFTQRDGCGTLISRDLYDGIRRATNQDADAILDLISPFMEEGSIVFRSKHAIEDLIYNYYVCTRDDVIVACGQINRFEGGNGELACLVVHPDYRGCGRGDAMLGYMKRVCLRTGMSNLFVLTTHAIAWFVERGFREVDPSYLPPSRANTYDHVRRSKVYMKVIEEERELDANGKFSTRFVFHFNLNYGL